MNNLNAIARPCLSAHRRHCFDCPFGWSGARFNQWSIIKSALFVSPSPFAIRQAEEIEVDERGEKNLRMHSESESTCGPCSGLSLSNELFARLHVAILSNTTFKFLSRKWQAMLRAIAVCRSVSQVVGSRYDLLPEARYGARSR